MILTPSWFEFPRATPGSFRFSTAPFHFPGILVQGALHPPASVANPQPPKSPKEGHTPWDGAESTGPELPLLTGWLVERENAFKFIAQVPLRGFPSLSTWITYSSIFLEHWNHKCNPDVDYVAIHLGDVTIIGLDLSQSHKLGRSKTLPFDFCKVQSPCGCCMTLPRTLYSDLCSLHRKPTHSGNWVSLADFTDDLGSSGVIFSIPLFQKWNKFVSVSQIKQFSDQHLFLEVLPSFPRSLFMWYSGFPWLFFLSLPKICLTHYLYDHLPSTWQPCSVLFWVFFKLK